MITVESIEAGGVRLHVEQAGAGEPIVFVHGGFTDGQAWRFVAPGLRAIAAALGALAPVGRRTYGGAGHMPHITHPRDVEAAVRARR